MGTYLNIAAQILRDEKRPLSARAILIEAHRRGIMPDALYGKTQHKTISARISEDIVRRRANSLFFRPIAGKFFLREFLDDNSLPSEFRKEAVTRRRIRELVRGPALAISFNSICKMFDITRGINPSRVLSVLKKQRNLYHDPKQRSDDLVFIKSFVCVVRGNKVLTYRLGKYRDDRDHFMSKRSLGFASFVNAHERSLFNDHDFGVVEAGVTATAIDLDMAITEPPRISAKEDAVLRKFLLCELPSGSYDLLGVVTFRCPDWFEPTKKRLALNDISWVDVGSPINDIDDFDPWSRAVLLDHYGKGDMFGYKID